MAEYLIQDTTLTGIADAIRAKTGGSDPIVVSDMASQIEGIETGGGTETTILASGTFASGATWELASDGLFTVSGTGAMDDYTSKDEQPWADYRTVIREVSIGSKITTIGACAFHSVTIPGIYIPSSVLTIGNSAFYNAKMNGVTFSSGLQTIEASAFYNNPCVGINIPDSVTSIGRAAFFCCTPKYVYIGSGVTSIAPYAIDAGNLTHVVFADTSTWYVGTSEGAKTTSVTVTNAETNATHFNSTHTSKYWTKV